MGIDIAQWYLEESLMLDGEMSISDSHRNASKLSNWLKNYERVNEAPMKLNELFQIGPHPTRTKEKHDVAVEIMCDYGWIKLRKWKNKSIHHANNSQ